MVDKNTVRRAYDKVTVYAAIRSTEGLGLYILIWFLDLLGASARILDACCGQGWPVDRKVRTVGHDIVIMSQSSVADLILLVDHQLK